MESPVSLLLSLCLPVFGLFLLVFILRPGLASCQAILDVLIINRLSDTRTENSSQSQIRQDRASDLNLEVRTFVYSEVRNWTFTI
jgi:hypothetical protein